VKSASQTDLSLSWSSSDKTSSARSAWSSTPSCSGRPVTSTPPSTSYQAEGHEIREEDITRLFPLKHRNMNLLGRYSFTASTPAAVALRPLSDADALELDEDDEGVD
jgi:hypothetical protein